MVAEYAALISIVVFVILILLEMHVAIAIGIAGVVGIVLIDGWGVAASALQTMPYSSTAKFALFVIPMYILLGSLISNSNIGERIFRAAARVTGRLPGGLAAATTLATAMFSGISGSSAADVAVFGRIAVGEMTKHGYSRAYAAAVVAAAGAFAALIPPSVTIVIYAVIAGESVGAMILAAIVPGILSAVVLAAFVVVSATVRKNRVKGAGIVIEAERVLTPAQAATEAVATAAHAVRAGGGRRDAKASRVALMEGGHETAAVAVKRRGTFFREELGAILIAGILFVIVAGGIYSGLVTATEAGALGALASLIIVAISIRKFKPFGKVVWDSVLDTARSTSMIFLILLGGSLFTYSLVLSGTPRVIAEWMSTLPLPPLAVVGLMLLLLLPLGTFLDGLSIMLITVPILAPVAIELGFSGVWFGVLVLKLIEIGLITPPVGINIFVVSGIVKEPAERIFRAVTPFILLDIAVTAVLFIFPDIILFLPRAAGLIP